LDEVCALTAPANNVARSNAVLHFNVVFPRELEIAFPGYQATIGLTGYYLGLVEPVKRRVFAERRPLPKSVTHFETRDAQI
jgi:hypothetical protein